MLKKAKQLGRQMETPVKGLISFHKSDNIIRLWPGYNNLACRCGVKRKQMFPRSLPSNTTGFDETN